MSNRGYAAPKGRAGNPPAELTKIKGGTFVTRWFAPPSGGYSGEGWTGPHPAPPTEHTRVKGNNVKTFEIIREVEYVVEAENEADALGVVLDVELLGRVRETPLPRIRPLNTRVERIYR